MQAITERTDIRSRLQSIIDRHAKSCDYLEIRLEETDRTEIRFLGQQLEDLKLGRIGGAAIRALKDGCWAFGSVENLDQLEPTLVDTIAAAKAAAVRHSRDWKLAKVSPVELEIFPSQIVDPRSISTEEKIRLMSEYNSLALEQPGITSSMTIYHDTASRIRFANSEGTWVDREVVDLACAIRPMATRNGETRMASVSRGSKNNFDICRGIGSEIVTAAAEALAKLDAQVIESGTYTVICDPHLAGVFVHEAFGHLSEGDNLADDKQMQEVLQLGRTFGGEFLNIFDSGLEEGMRGYLPVDDEGVPGRKTDLIRDGKLVGRLHSRETAGKLGEEPTGNCRAISYRFPPIPRMRNTCIAPGPHGKLEDMIKDVPNGLYAVDAFGGQTNGELFTFTAGDAFMIRNGEVAERVKDVTISGNLFDTLRNIDRVGSEFGNHDSAGGCGKAGQMPLPVSHGSPHIRIQECVIGGR
jgi:TldD protein